MKQPVLDSNPALINLGGSVSGGLLELGASLNLQTMDHAGFTAELNDFITKYSQHQQGKENRAIRSAGFKVASRNARTFLRLARDVMKPILGYHYSQAWNALGFVHSLVVPICPAQFGPMLHLLRDYLVAHPTAEAASMNVTAAQATSILNAFTTAQQSLATHELSLKTMAKQRDAKANILRAKIRLLIAELTSVLPSVDPRWERFGLNQPGIKQRPPTPSEVSAELIAPNTLSVKWPAAPRAEYYRLWVKVIGVDEESQLVGTPADPNFLLENLPPKTEAEISLSALNNGGESARSSALRVSTS